MANRTSIRKGEKIYLKLNNSSITSPARAKTTNSNYNMANTLSQYLPAKYLSNLAGPPIAGSSKKGVSPNACAK